MACTATTVTAALRAAADTVAEHRGELVDLDRAIGDGDHGENLYRGFEAWRSAGTGDDPAAVLKSAAMTLISKVGGAAGPLYGTALLRASAAVRDRAELDAAAVAAALGAALEGVRSRGKAEVGDKTMVDALTPAVTAAEGADTVAAALAAAADAAAAAAEATSDLVARKGRASYLGERSRGHVDPGARSTALILRALADAAEG